MYQEFRRFVAQLERLKQKVQDTQESRWHFSKTIKTSFHGDNRHGGPITSIDEAFIQQVDLLFVHIDEDKSGSISFLEFYTYINMTPEKRMLRDRSTSIRSSAKKIAVQAVMQMKDPKVKIVVRTLLKYLQVRSKFSFSSRKDAIEAGIIHTHTFLLILVPVPLPLSLNPTPPVPGPCTCPCFCPCSCPCPCPCPVFCPCLFPSFRYSTQSRSTSRRFLRRSNDDFRG